MNYLRIYPPKHPMGHPTLWLWQVCSMGDIEMSGTSDDKQDAFDTASTALDAVMWEEMGRDTTTVINGQEFQ